jgi:hypothetical protein
MLGCPDKQMIVKRWFNIWAALITGVPLALLVAYGQRSFDYDRSWDHWFTFSLTALLSAAVLGAPQGLLAAVPAFHRVWWRRAALLGTMTLLGFVSLVATVVMVARLRLIGPSGEWQLIKDPPGRIIRLVGPIHDHRGLSATTAYAITEDGKAFRFELGAWNPVDSIPASDGRRPSHGSATPPVPGGEMSRVVFGWVHIHFGTEHQLALAADGRLWLWSRDWDAHWPPGVVQGYVVMTPVLNLVAWVVVIRRDAFL